MLEMRAAGDSYPSGAEVGHSLRLLHETTKYHLCMDTDLCSSGFRCMYQHKQQQRDNQSNGHRDPQLMQRM